MVALCSAHNHVKGFTQRPLAGTERAKALPVASDLARNPAIESMASLLLNLQRVDAFAQPSTMLLGSMLRLPVPANVRSGEPVSVGQDLHLGIEHRVAHVALMDPGTPVWFRLDVDLATKRVLSSRMIAGMS